MLAVFFVLLRARAGTGTLAGKFFRLFPPFLDPPHGTHIRGSINAVALWAPGHVQRASLPGTGNQTSTIAASRPRKFVWPIDSRLGPFCCFDYVLQFRWCPRGLCRAVSRRAAVPSERTDNHCTLKNAAFMRHGRGGSTVASDGPARSALGPFAAQLTANRPAQTHGTHETWYQCQVINRSLRCLPR